MLSPWGEMVWGLGSGSVCLSLKCAAGSLTASREAPCSPPLPTLHPPQPAQAHVRGRTSKGRLLSRGWLCITTRGVGKLRTEGREL